MSSRGLAVIVSDSKVARHSYCLGQHSRYHVCRTRVGAGPPRSADDVPEIVESLATVTIPISH